MRKLIYIIALLVFSGSAFSQSMSLGFEFYFPNKKINTGFLIKRDVGVSKGSYFLLKNNSPLSVDMHLLSCSDFCNLNALPSYIDGISFAATIVFLFYPRNDPWNYLSSNPYKYDYLTYKYMSGNRNNCCD